MNFKDMQQNPDKYRKFWVTLAGIAVYALTQFLGAESDWVAVITMTLTALGVYQAKNEVK